jgi:thymidine kinase
MDPPFIPGRIDLIIGPMFSGKTSELIRRVWCAQYQQLRCLFLSHSPDALSDDELSVDFIPCHALLPLWRESLQYDVIAIDQAQFFPDVPQFAQLMANSGKIVIVSGLDGTYERKPFGTFLDLISSCESLRKVSAILEDSADEAFFTRLVTDDAYAAATRSSYFAVQTVGFIHLVIGPALAGKSAELYRLLNRYVIARRKCVLVRPPEKPALPNPQTLPESGGMINTVPVIDADTLPPREQVREYDVIGVDRGEKYAGLADWADGCANEGKVVYIAAADGNEEQEPFREIVELIPRCEQINKLQAICFKTGLPAPFWVLEGTKIVPVSRYALLGGVSGVDLKSRNLAGT